MQTKINSNALGNLIISGDFNFVSSVSDRNTNRYTQTDTAYKDIWTNFEIQNNILDTFRTMYPKRRLYTFSQSGGNSKSRIDRIYFSSDLIGRVQNVKFENYECFDHKLVKLRLKSKIDIGPGTWIFNTTLLKNLDFTTKISTIIYNYANNNIFPNKKYAWEFFKMEFKSFSLKYSKSLARERRRDIDIVRNKLNIL